MRLEKLYAGQIEAMKAAELPKFEGAAPPPTQSAADVEMAGIDYRRKVMRRASRNQTVFAGNFGGNAQAA